MVPGHREIQQRRRHRNDAPLRQIEHMQDRVFRSLVGREHRCGQGDAA
jgi:hypothetical protein